MSWPRAALQLSSLVTGLAIAAAVSTARAQDATSKTTIDMNVSGTITTDYNYRGYTLSDHQPSISTNLQPTYGIFYAGINAASVEMPQLSRIQMTDFVGVKPVSGLLTFDVGAQYYSYPGSEIQIDYFEFYAAPTYAVNPRLTLGLNVYYAPDYDRTGAWENYNSGTFKYALDSNWKVSGELGWQSFGTTRPIRHASAAQSPSPAKSKVMNSSPLPVRSRLARGSAQVGVLSSLDLVHADTDRAVDASLTT